MKTKHFGLIVLLTVVLGVSGLGRAQGPGCDIDILALDTSTFDAQILGDLYAFRLISALSILSEADGFDYLLVESSSLPRINRSMA